MGKRPTRSRHAGPNVNRAQALDLRRQQQIANQKASIDRLLKLLNRAHATFLEYEHSQLLGDELRAVFADLPSATVAGRMESNMGKVKDAFLAGFAAGETEDDAKESWKAYKAEREEAADEDGPEDDE